MCSRVWGRKTRPLRYHRSAEEEEIATGACALALTEKYRISTVIAKERSDCGDLWEVPAISYAYEIATACIASLAMTKGIQVSLQRFLLDLGKGSGVLLRREAHFFNDDDAVHRIQHRGNRAHVILAQHQLEHLAKLGQFHGLFAQYIHALIQGGTQNIPELAVFLRLLVLPMLDQSLAPGMQPLGQFLYLQYFQ